MAKTAWQKIGRKCLAEATRYTRYTIAVGPPSNQATTTTTQFIEFYSLLRIRWCCTLVGACYWQSWQHAMPIGVYGCKSGNWAILFESETDIYVQTFTDIYVQDSYYTIHYTVIHIFWIRTLKQHMQSCYKFQSFEAMDYHFAISDHVLCHLDASKRRLVCNRCFVTCNEIRFQLWQLLWHKVQRHNSDMTFLWLFQSFGTMFFKWKCSNSDALRPFTGPCCGSWVCHGLYASVVSWMSWNEAANDPMTCFGSRLVEIGDFWARILGGKR